jgi:hypothetical protein
MSTAAGLVCMLPIGSGDWTAYLADRLTGAELPLERTTWRGSAGRAYRRPSEASIVLDPEYAARFGRRPLLWSNELRYRRDDGLMWTGPIVSVDDDPDDGVVWEARDRMELVVQRRWFWRTGAYSGDTARLMSIALDAGDYSDPTLLVRDERSTGVIVDMPVVAGDKIGDALEAIGVPWTVVGDVVRYGDILVESGFTLEADGFGDNRPPLRADGYERLSHVCAVTENNGRVFFPSADPEDRDPGSPLLVDTIDVGDVSVGAARQLARQAWLRRRGELAVVSDADSPLPFDFPLQADTLVPGAVLTSSSAGRQLTAERIPVYLDSVNFEIADGVENASTGELVHATEIDVTDRTTQRLGPASNAGTFFPTTETYPLDQLDGHDWNELDLDPVGDFDPGDPGGPLPKLDPIRWDPQPPIPPFGPDGAPTAADEPEADDGCACFKAPIWLCTTLRGGDTTWTSLDGDTRTLSPRHARQTADGGLITHANQGQPQMQFYDPNNQGDLTSGVLRYDIEVTCHWDYPADDGVHSYCYFRFGDWNFAAMILHPGWFNNPPSAVPPEPEFHALHSAYNPGSFADATLDSDPSTVPGLTGFTRGRMVAEYDIDTGDAELWLGLPGGALVSQGAKNILGAGTADAGGGFEFNWDYTGKYNLPANYTHVVLHSAIVQLDGVDLMRADAAAMNSIVPPHRPGVELLDQVYGFGPGGYQLFGGSFDSWFTFSPNGSPLLISVDGTGDDDPNYTGNEPIWVDGDPLIEPAIAAANRLDPAHIEIYNAQPSEWLPANGDAHLVYAIADLAGFDNVRDGWPSGFWPFGPRIH